MHFQRLPLLILAAGCTAAATPAVTPAPSVSMAAAPCTHAVDACKRWVTFDAGPARSLVYATHPLDVPNPALTRALVMVHGAGRNADHYFETATAAGFLADALGNTLIIAPRFAAGRDSLAPNEIAWPERGENWRSGGTAQSTPPLTSFDFADTLVRILANKQRFPNLRSIVIAGHSAGGQFATRYAMVNRVHDTPGVRLSYVVANPSSYAWPTALRPLPVGDAVPTRGADEALGPDGEKVHTDFTYGPFDSTKAPGYNRWPAGLDNLTGYARGMNPDQLRRQLVERPTTFLLGHVDVLPLGGFDSSPNAMAQGPTRRSRGEAFAKYLADSLGAKHRVIIVSECGHNARCVFTTDAVLPTIFPK